MQALTPESRLRLERRALNVQCDGSVAGQAVHPNNRSRASLRKRSTRMRNCGCPYPEQLQDCWDCCVPSVLETRILHSPKVCCKPECNFVIPAIPCWDRPKSPKPVRGDPLCFDWTVDEPGPNDSYGLNGLNWYDWKMESINTGSEDSLLSSYVPNHPGFSKKAPPPNSPVYQCALPIMCYSRPPTLCRPARPITDVDYFQDWRCCEAKAPPAWRPPFARWATNHHL